MARMSILGSMLCWGVLRCGRWVGLSAHAGSPGLAQFPVNPKSWKFVAVDKTAIEWLCLPCPNLCGTLQRPLGHHNTNENIRVLQRSSIHQQKLDLSFRDAPQLHPPTTIIQACMPTIRSPISLNQVMWRVLSLNPPQPL